MCDTNETTWEPIKNIRETDPITLANYAKKKKIMNLKGWKWAKDYVNNGRTINLLKRILRVNKKKTRSGTIYQFGVAVPRNTRQAYLFDQQNGNTAWADAIDDEMEKLDTFETFRMLPTGEQAPSDYSRIPLHMCFAVKWDRRRKARLVAGGNWTSPEGVENYSGVVSNETVRTGIFLAQLNYLDIMVGDVSNAYLHSKTKEKIYTVAGPEFKEYQGRTMIIKKALYGLRTSNVRWAEKIAADLREMGWRQTKYDKRLWIRDAGENYELPRHLRGRNLVVLQKCKRDYGTNSTNIPHPAGCCGHDDWRPNKAHAV